MNILTLTRFLVGRFLFLCSLTATITIIIITIIISGIVVVNIIIWGVVLIIFISGGVIQPKPGPDAAGQAAGVAQWVSVRERVLSNMIAAIRVQFFRGAFLCLKPLSVKYCAIIIVSIPGCGSSPPPPTLNTIIPCL